MDDWNRKIVRPLALHAFRRKIKEHRASYELLGSLDDAEIALWTRYGALGERLLEHYFAWCATVDDFESVLSDHELRAPVPDPSVAGRDLVAPDRRALRYVSPQLSPSAISWSRRHRAVPRGAIVDGGDRPGDRSRRARHDGE